MVIELKFNLGIGEVEGGMGRKKRNIHYNFIRGFKSFEMRIMNKYLPHILKKIVDRNFFSD